MVAVMKQQLIALGPQLKINSEEVSKLMKIVEKQKIEADKVRNVVAADEAVAKVLIISLILIYVNFHLSNAMQLYISGKS